jgi:type II secretory pathway pseudopilin PulG
MKKTLMPVRARRLTFLRRLARDEGGFTIVESIVAVTILAVGGFAVAQSLIFGLETSGASRERLAARAAAEQQMELARALNYDSLVLDDNLDIPHSTDPDDPDYWVDEDDQTFDPDGDGPLGHEPLFRIPGASPALHHLQTPVEAGNASYAIYMYVTWVDSPTDGLDAADEADGNGDGEDDSDGKDVKRTTVVVTWPDPLGAGATRRLTMGSLFSQGTIPYQGAQAPANVPPVVGCPTYTSSGLDVTFAATVSDEDGTVTSITWDFGDGSTGSGETPSHTYPAPGTYTIVNTANDDGGGSGTNAGQDCEVVVAASGGGAGPDGTISIASGAAYTTQTQVTLVLDATGATLTTQMQFSDDGTTWSTPEDYETSRIYTLPSGDGTKTVYVRFIDGGDPGTPSSDTIVLDTTPPDAPTSLSATSSTSGANKTVVLSWNAPFPLPADLAGYQVWKRKTTSTTWQQVTSCTSGTTCSDTFKKQDSYEYYVVAVDQAGNISAESNHVTK